MGRPGWIPHTMDSQPWDLILQTHNVRIIKKIINTMTTLVQDDLVFSK